MDVQQEAKILGWVPQEEFQGDPAKWVDADTFVERGKVIMPILRKNNERLEHTVSAQQSEIQRLQQMFSASQEAISELQRFHSDQTKLAVERAKKAVLAELKSAREEGDVDLELQLTDQLVDLKAAEKEAAAKPAQPQPQTQPPTQQFPPDFLEWTKENDWYGKDARKTRLADGIAQQLRSDPSYDKITGREFYDTVGQMVSDKLNPPRPDKVSGSRPSGGGSGGGKSYADLPAEAKDACNRQGAKLVGNGRAFKDTASWQAYYAKTYFEGDQ